MYFWRTCRKVCLLQIQITCFVEGGSPQRGESWWRIDDSSADGITTADWSSHRPINLPLPITLSSPRNTEYSHLPPALFPYDCASLRLWRDPSPWPVRQNQAGLTLCLPLDINSVHLVLKTFVSETSPPVVWVVFTFVSARLCVRSPTVTEACMCQVQWRWHLVPRAEIMKVLTLQVKHIRLLHPGPSDMHPSTWVIWMGRHPPFHVHWAVCTVKSAKKGPHHHNHHLPQTCDTSWCT